LVGRRETGSVTKAVVRIPLVDLRAQYDTLREEIDDALSQVVASAAFIKGPQVAQFEEAFAAYCEADAVVGVANGTDALELALEALDLPEGGEVVTVPTSFIATTEAISRAGQRVRFVDVEPTTWLMAAQGLADALGPEVVAVVPVHLYGHPVDLDGICKVAATNDVRVVEDAAQAHGARLRGRRVGAIGDVGTFSFYPGKNLGAYGDAGAVASNSTDLLGTVRLLADHGRRDKYEHLVEGRNSRLDTLQAAVLMVKLRHLDEHNAARRRLAERYRDNLDGLTALEFPELGEGAEAVHHLLVVSAQDRDGLRAFLGDRGVATGVHYPIPLHLQPAYRHLGYARGDFPVAERLAASLVSLPLYPELPVTVVDEISEAVLAFYATA
jgi:dTDP-4-amino-4,6-dideoxygalactose transaminase